MFLNLWKIFIKLFQRSNKKKQNNEKSQQLLIKSNSISLNSPNQIWSKENSSRKLSKKHSRRGSVSQKLVDDHDTSDRIVPLKKICSRRRIKSVKVLVH